MATIKARDLKVGMYLRPWGTVEEVSAVVNGRIEITFSFHDYESGEDEFFPCDLAADEALTQ